MTMPLQTQTTVAIFGATNAWSLAPLSGDENGRVCAVDLQIVGNSKDGYHLVMHPDGFFAADSWHESEAQAIDCAQELLGVGEAAWQRISSGNPPPSR
jgi:hypothetical protein